MDAATLLTALTHGLLVGVVYAIYGIITKRDAGEPVVPRKAARTVVLFAAAGAVVAVSGGQPTEQAVTSTLPEVSVVGVAFDMAWGRLKRERLLPPWLANYEQG